MMRKFLGTLLIASGFGGCASDTAPQSGRAVDRPSFLRFLPGQDGGVRLKAPYGGVLTQQGPCLGLLDEQGFFSTVVWPETARLERGPRGLVLRDARSGVTARLGDRIEGTGGPLPKGARFELGPPVLNHVMPIECARRPVPQRASWSGPGWIAIVNPAFVPSVAEDGRLESKKQPVAARVSGPRAR